MGTFEFDYSGFQSNPCDFFVCDVSNICIIGVHGIGLSLYVSWDSTELSSKIHRRCNGSFYSVAGVGCGET